MTQDTIRWGILAPSGIAHQFVKDIQIVDGAQVVAVGSRELGRAQQFADEFGIPRAYGSYEELLDDPDVDVVYVSSVTSKHPEHVKLALNHGKAVLCEKAFALNSAQAEEMVALARSKGLFLMEAMWTRTHPIMLEIGRRVQTGQIGHVRLINASLGPIGFPKGHRVMDPELGGGILLECGIYPINLVYHVLHALGEPAGVEAWSTFAATGVDDSTTVVLSYDEGAYATLATSLVEDVSSGLPSAAFISGTEGWIDIPTDIFFAKEFTIYRAGKEPETVRVEPIGNGYTYEIEEVDRCLRDGRTESELVSLDDTLVVMRVMDRARQATGFVYPVER